MACCAGVSPGRIRPPGATMFDVTDGSATFVSCASSSVLIARALEASVSKPDARVRFHFVQGYAAGLYHGGVQSYIDTCLTKCIQCYLTVEHAQPETPASFPFPIFIPKLARKGVPDPGRRSPRRHPPHYFREACSPRSGSPSHSRGKVAFAPHPPKFLRRLFLHECVRARVTLPAIS